MKLKRDKTSIYISAIKSIKRSVGNNGVSKNMAEKVDKVIAICNEIKFRIQESYVYSEEEHNFYNRILYYNKAHQIEKIMEIFCIK